MHRTTTASGELLGVLAVLVAACALLASPTPVPTGEVGVLAGVVGLALWAWCRSRGDVAALRALGAPSTAVRARRRAVVARAVPRQADPDVPGRPRPRAPGTTPVAQARHRASPASRAGRARAIAS